MARDLVEGCRSERQTEGIERVVQPTLGVDLRVLDPRRKGGVGLA